MFGRHRKEPPHLKARLLALDRLSPQAPPSPWGQSAQFDIGGLTEAGFVDSSDFLLIVSHAGRGLFDCVAGRSVFRDPSTKYPCDPGNLTVAGIGPFASDRVRVGGLWGGGLAASTSDGWSLRRHPDGRLAEELFLISPGRALIDARSGVDGFTRFGGFVSEVRPFGFSPTGRSFVVATSSDVVAFTRD